EILLASHLDVVSFWWVLSFGFLICGTTRHLLSC
ncbi:hypothetical protein AALP_AAs39002U000800, partial [Arabis alpina]